MLEQDRAGKLAANGLSDQNRRLVTGHRDRDRVGLSGRGAGPAQPQLAGYGVPVRGVACDQRGGERRGIPVAEK